LSASYSNLNHSTSSFNDSFNNGSRASKPRSHTTLTSNAKGKVVRCLSNPHEEYVPPPAPPEATPPPPTEEHRVLPSVDAIFFPNAAAQRKLTSPSNQATSERPTMTSVDRSKDFQKAPSSRSWDGDLGDPLSNPADPFLPSSGKPPLSGAENVKASSGSNSKYSPDNRVVAGPCQPSSSSKRKSRKQKTGRSRSNETGVSSDGWFPEAATPVVS
jgi:hypothetical protein